MWIIVALFFAATAPQPCTVETCVNDTQCSGQSFCNTSLHACQVVSCALHPCSSFCLIPETCAVANHECSCSTCFPAGGPHACDVDAARFIDEVGAPVPVAAGKSDEEDDE
jgi:hypothetical protein